MPTVRTQDDLEAERGARRGFVHAQVRSLRSLQFVTFVMVSERGFAYVEVSRDERGDAFTVEVGGIPAPEPQVRAALRALGFTDTDPGARLRWQGSAAAQVAGLVTSVLDGPLAVAPDAPLDVRHGSRRAEVELERKLTRIRHRVRAVVDSLVGADAVSEDADGDLVFPFESTRVWVGTRALAHTETLVRVFALASVDVDASPALGLFLAQANFALAIGKFSLDPVRRAVWFEEALLGEAFSDEELRRVIELVALTTNEYDEQIAHLFGGHTAAQAAPSPPEREHEKPGSSGYL